MIKLTSQNSFTELLRGHASSTVYLTGCILYTVGTLLALLIGFSVTDIISTAIAFLPIFGIWLFFFGSDNFHTGLTLFKVSAIIGLVLFCITMGVITLAALTFFIMAIIFRDTFGVSNLDLAATFFVLMTIIALFVVFIKFYFAALLNTLKSIKEGINGKEIHQIKGVVPFMVFSFIGIAFDIIWVLIFYVFGSAIDMFVHSLIELFPADLHEVLEDIIPPLSDNIFNLILTVISKIGLVLLLITLRKFALAVSLKSHACPPAHETV
jgi:hypothetical protein